MTDSPITTGIYIAAALIGIIGGLLGIIIFIRQRQFARPTLQLFVGWHSPPEDVPRKARKRRVTVFAVAPKHELREPLLAVLTFRLKNPGKEALRNVRVSIEYGRKYLVKNQLFASLAEFKPALVADLSDSETAAFIHSAVTKDEMEKALEARVVTVFADRAQVTMEFPVVRPGEWFMLYDLLMLSGSGPDEVRKLGFGGPGFNHVLEKARRV